MFLSSLSFFKFLNIWCSSFISILLTHSHCLVFFPLFFLILFSVFLIPDFLFLVGLFHTYSASIITLCHTMLCRYSYAIPILSPMPIPILIYDQTGLWSKYLHKFDQNATPPVCIAQYMCRKWCPKKYAEINLQLYLEEGWRMSSGSHTNPFQQRIWMYWEAEESPYWITYNIAKRTLLTGEKYGILCSHQHDTFIQIWCMSMRNIIK